MIQVYETNKETFVSLLKYYDGLLDLGSECPLEKIEDFGWMFVLYFKDGKQFGVQLKGVEEFEAD